MKNETKMSAEKVVKQPKPKLMNIKIEKLHPFENHPYKVLDDDSMTELKESIAEQGFLNRIIVRPLEDKPDEYEIISGHRRVHAAELLEMKEVPAVVHFIDRDESTVMMVDSNCQRENLTLMEMLIGTGYTIEEVDTPTRYVVPDKQTAAVEWNKVTNKSFDNVLKKFNVTVTKSDSEKGLPQGDASLAGAKYGIYKGNQLIDTYTTDANGQFTTKYYICGDDWSLKEISPSEGYLLNTESQHIGAEAKLYTRPQKSLCKRQSMTV